MERRESDDEKPEKALRLDQFTEWGDNCEAGYGLGGLCLL